LKVESQKLKVESSENIGKAGPVRRYYFPKLPEKKDTASLMAGDRPS